MFAVAGDELADPALGDAVVACDVGWRASFDGDGGDHELGFGHARKSTKPSLPMSRDMPLSVADVPRHAEVRVADVSRDGFPMS